MASYRLFWRISVTGGILYALMIVAMSAHVIRFSLDLLIDGLLVLLVFAVGYVVGVKAGVSSQPPSENS